ncbi:hypothetical protein RO3G_04446 [Rhizopus delemar RA 99-880]|uniref:Uncharacterized protein n=1 Tax=Rhizopus delemar (strain RA 99-880 / ATCC MYA-4621 / FGSC 9543 / NRRL 43880) TaxID=246409 RepID=I1BU61_RHIO9|nr:hypothetical protein RO3G_04446 [Rhizopus delemar RA 99-880]|eukprot:EIE79741.1 hypothetical protein RO3G_04446 [Rhizopus delemar RA 99-880]
MECSQISPRNFDNKVTDVSQLNLEADESEMIVCYTTSTTNNEETAEGNVDETKENDNTEQNEQRADIIERKKRLREAYETILKYKVPLDDLDLVKNVCVAPLNRIVKIPLNQTSLNRATIVLFNDPMIVNLVVKSLLGTDVPEDIYTVTSNEWANGSRSDIVYMVKDKPTAERPPIIIEFQYKVSRDFMNRVISYSLSAYCRYKAYPVVLIFAIKGFLSVDIEKGFSCGDESPFLKIESRFWAKDCLLISQSSIDKFLSRSPMKPIVDLGYYLIAGSLSLDSLGYQLDPTFLRR